MQTAIYQAVTDRIIAALETGVRPWAKSWDNTAPAAPSLQRPLRVNGDAYTGINTLNLWIAAQARGFRSRYWLTYKGAQAIGGQVRKGSKSEYAFYVGQHVVKDDAAEDGEEGRVVNFLRCYHVFNADEIDNLPDHYYAAEAAPAPDEARIASVDAFVANTGATLRHGGNKAYFMPSQDCVVMPALAQFHTPTDYYATLLHELTHWTMLESRCNRNVNGRNETDYANEELVAELGAAFLCADLGLSNTPREDHASYIASWLKVLKDDNRAVFKAAAKAERAAKFLHGLQPAATSEAIEQPAEPVPTPAPVLEPAEPVATPSEAIEQPATPAPSVAETAAAAGPVRDYASFSRALSAARVAAREALGPKWHVIPGATRVGRVPARWVACKVFGRISRTPRDIRLPEARFWQGGAHPAGIVWAVDAPALPTARHPSVDGLAPSHAAYSRRERVWAKAHGLERVLIDGKPHYLDPVLAHVVRAQLDAAPATQAEAA